jgi:hypothetical protein
MMIKIKKLLATSDAGFVPFISAELSPKKGKCGSQLLT